DDALGLATEDRPRREDTAEPRVLGEVVEVAPVPGIPGQVYATAQQHVEALGPSLAAEDDSHRVGQLGVERPAQDQSGREGGCRAAGPAVGGPAVRGIGAGIREEQRRYAEAWDPRDIPSTLRVRRRGLRILTILQAVPDPAGEKRE